MPECADPTNLWYAQLKEAVKEFYRPGMDMKVVLYIKADGRLKPAQVTIEKPY